MSYSPEEMNRFYYLYTQGVAVFKENREKTINQLSPYSKRINCFIRTEKELDVYIKSNLKEYFITRPSLIIEVDLNYKDPKGATNLTRMRNGNPPYDYITNSVIDLHHIGQQYDSPFAELPHAIHDSSSTYSLLHQCDIVSWRNDKRLLNATQREIGKYWKLRSEL